MRLLPEVRMKCYLQDANTYISSPSSPQVVDFANHYQELISMGYTPVMAAGALAHTGNKLAEATETCLNASS